MTKEKTLSALREILDERMTRTALATNGALQDENDDWIAALRTAIDAIEYINAQRPNVISRDDKIALMSYKLIRRAARDLAKGLSDTELGNYVRGVVDLQTEMYGTDIFETYIPLANDEDDNAFFQWTEGERKTNV